MTAMKSSKKVLIAVAAITLPLGIAFRSSLRHLPFLGPPAPVKKWEFRTMRSLVQENCTKPDSPFYNWSPFRSDASLPDHLLEHSPAIDKDGTIYVGAAKGLYALNPDGSVKWFAEVAEFGFNFQVPYQPVMYAFVDDFGQIWFDFKAKYETGTAGLFRVDANGEHAKGIVSAVHTVTKAGLLEDGTIFVQWDQTGPAFQNPDGTPQWQVVSATNGKIRQEWWDAEFGVPQDCHPPSFGTNGIRYVGCKNEVIALNPDRSKKWSFATHGYWAAEPAVAEDGTIYVGSEDGNLYALGPDGSLRWKFATSGEVRSTPAIARNGTIFFGSADHYLYAVGPDGTAKWQFKAGGAVYSPNLGPDGTIYALSADGNLYAIEDLEPNGGLSGQWAKWAGDMRNTWRGPKTTQEDAAAR